MRALLSLAGCLVLTAVAPAQSPSYARDIRPFLTKYCLECHNSKKDSGGLNLESYQTLLQGGDSGPAIVAGKADQSRLVLMVEGKGESKMPPKKAQRQPKPAEFAIVRAWVDAGAKDDSTAVQVTLPPIKPRQQLAPPVTALAYLPEGEGLLAAVGNQVVTIDSRQGTLRESRSEPQPVTALGLSKEVSLCATGLAGSSSQLHAVGPHLNRVLSGVHKDRIHRIAFSPDGKRFLTCSYDTQVKLWSVASLTELHTLREHSDAVYGLTWHPEGKFFATCGADRALKVWSQDGKLLYTLGEAADWLYTCAWCPDGKHLAAAGVDRSIRVWEVDEEGGKVVHSVFAHEGPVVQIVYSSDGKTLYSAGEDRILKAWEAGSMVEQRVYPKQPDHILALAVRPDGKQMAVGRYDGVLVLLDPADGKVQAQPLPVKDSPKTSASPQGIKETEPNNSPGSGQKITLPTTLTGSLDRAGDIDCFRFEVKAGQQLGVQVQGQNPKVKFEPILTLLTPDGQVLAESEAGHLGHTFEKAGTYALCVRDREFRGETGLTYRLRAGDVPVVTSIFPLGLQRGTRASIQVEGVHLGGQRAVTVQAEPMAEPGARLALPLIVSGTSPLGLPKLVVGEFPEVRAESGKTLTLPVPGTGNGIISRPGQTGLWRFQARKGQRLIVEVEARRLGSALDSYLEVLDNKAQPIGRATLRSLAKTYVTFRDHDSVTANIRIEAWGELAVNDYIYVGSELLRIRSLPTHPDADCIFFSNGGQRRGYLDTTPTHLPQGLPMYKVAIHPPGVSFPPNGFPVVQLYYRNDDGGPAYGRDSRLFFDPPADGEYLIRIGDSRGQGGSNCAYRLTVRPPRPSFEVSFHPTTPAVYRGGALPINVNVNRLDGYEGPIDLRLENVPPGFSAPKTNLPPEDNSTAFALWADAEAKDPGKMAPLKLVAEARIAGQLVRKEVTGGVPRLVDPGEILTSTEQSEITIRPGGRTKLTVRIERRQGFTGRVPIEVKGLPHGVKVLDIGLNGILITEKETVRTMVLYCEPWVQPIEHPIVVLARREGKNTEHAARSVLLKVK